MKYRYALLRHQPTLQTETQETFAVLVEGQVAPGLMVVFTVGRSPEPASPISGVGEAVLSKFPEVLANSIGEAVRSKNPDEDVLDWIHKSMSWNFYATEPVSIEATDKIHELAFKLFSEKVAGADQLLSMLMSAMQHRVRPAVKPQNLGETFQALVPIPQAKPVAMYASA